MKIKYRHTRNSFVLSVIYIFSLFACSHVTNIETDSEKRNGPGNDFEDIVYRGVGDIELPDGKAIGTAFIANPGDEADSGNVVLLSASHIFYSADNSLKANTFFFRPAYKKRSRYKVNLEKTNRVKTDDGKVVPTHDWAVLTIRNVGAIGNPLPIGVRDEAAVTSPSSSAMLVYYRPDVDDVVISKDCRFIKKSTGSNFVFKHNCNLVDGASGAPLFLIKNGGAIVVAIQSIQRHRGSLAVNPDKVQNIASRITAEIEGYVNLAAGDKLPH